MNHQPRGNYEVAISSRWVNFDHEYFTDGYRRALNFLSNRSIVTVPEELCRQPDAEVCQWLQEHHCRYYLYQPPLRLLGHFHPKSRGGVPITKADTEWRLYEIRGGEAHRVEIKPVHGWPKNVPGL